MLIKTKQIDCASKNVFKTWKLPTSAVDTSGDIYWSAVVYIQDTGEIWTHGKLYGGFFSNADNNKVSLTIGGTERILSLDGHVQPYTTLTGSGTIADQAILSTGVANKWTLKTLGKNAFSNEDYLPIDATAEAAKKVINALRFQYNGVDMHSFDGSEARLLNIIQGDNVFITGDGQGNVTIAADPGSDTVNTAGATNKIDTKLFLIGAESQTTAPQTYSNQYVYIGTDNCLYSLGKKVLTDHQTIYNLDLQTLISGETTKVITFDPNAANNSFTLVQGTNVTLVPDAQNKRVTISSKDTTYDFYNLIFKQGETVIDTYKPTTSPDKTFKAGTNVTFSKNGDDITITTQDTRNTAGTTEKANTKLFLVGAESQGANPQTYSNAKVYIGIDGKLYSDNKEVSTGDHTHNYAGAKTPGGPALKIDLNPDGLLDAEYGTYGGIIQDSNNGPTSGSWSNRIKILHNNSSGYYTELAQNFTGTAGVWHRRNVAGVISEWTPLLDKSNFHTYLDGTYIQKQTDPNQLKNFVRYSLESGLTINWTAGNVTPTQVIGFKENNSAQAYTFNGDNIRAFANAVNRSGDTMSGNLTTTGIILTTTTGITHNGKSSSLLYCDGTNSFVGMSAATTYIRSGNTDLFHKKNGTDYKIWDASNLVGLQTAHSHNTINIIDSRDKVSTPQEHSSGVWLDFKSNANAGLDDGGTYTGLLTVRKYGNTTDWTGGKVAQLGFTDNSNVWIRFGSGTAWESWKQIATTGWANGKFLPLAGGTMTGSITISTDSVVQWSRNTDYAKIHYKNTSDSDADSYLGFEVGDNGNEYFKFSSKNGSTTTQWASIKSDGIRAAGFRKDGSSDSYILLGGGGHKALTELFRYLGQNVNNDWNSVTTMGTMRVTQQTITNGPTGAYNYGQLLTFNAGGTLSQIYLPHSNTGGMYIRTGWSGVSQYYAWIQVLTTANYASTLDSRYVNVSGDTMTGTLSWSMNGITSSIGSNNASWLHFNTSAPNGFWFSKNVSVQGEIYAGSSYNQKVWHAGNDGSGSGLDADLLDGFHEASLFRSGISTVNGESNLANIPANRSGSYILTHSGWTGSAFIMYAGSSNSTMGFMIKGGQSALVNLLTTTDSSPSKWTDRGILLTSSNYTSYVSKIGTATVGSATRPIYLNAGVPTPGTYTFGNASGNAAINNGTLCTNLNADMLDGAHLSDLGLKRTYTLSTSGLSTSSFYPIMFLPGNNDLWVEIASQSGMASAAYNTNRLNFIIHSHGWDDSGESLTILNRYNYSDSEITIGAIGVGNQEGGIAVWVRGGIGNVTVKSNYAPALKTSNYTYGGQTFTVGSNLYGGSNTEVSVMWQNNSSKNNNVVAYLNSNVASATNADTLDGIHASGLFTSLANSGNNISVTIGGTNRVLTPAYASKSGSADSATYATKVQGSYTGNGGQQQPTYFGKNWVGFRMMNTTVNGNSNYKDWIISDCYNGSDVGGAVAFGVNRQQLGAYIMGSNADRSSWVRSGEFYGTWNLNPSKYYDSTISRTANTVLAAPNGSAGGATFRRLVAADIPALDYISTKGGYSQPIILLAGYVYRGSNTSTSWTWSGSKVSAISSISCKASGGVVTMTLNKATGRNVYCYAACANMATSGDITNGSGAFDGRDDGAEWMGTYVQSYTTIYIRSMYQRNQNNGSWGSNNINGSDSATRIYVIACGYYT